MDGKFGENNQLNPDIEVYNSPEDVLAGHDRQLEAAVNAILKKYLIINIVSIRTNANV